MSKKIIFIAVLSAGMLFSCQKENIVPHNTNTLSEEPALRGSVSNGNTDFDGDITTSNEIKDLDVVKDEYITDPNNDEDRNKKKKGNH